MVTDGFVDLLSVHPRLGAKVLSSGTDRPWAMSRRCVDGLGEVLGIRDMQG